MAALSKICKLYGSINVKGTNGKEVLWVYDYVNDKPRIKSEMTKEEFAASEKARFVMPKNWECNSCGFQEYTDAISQDDIDRYLQCSNCGESEFHLADKK